MLHRTGTGRRFSYANVAATIALVFALGPSAAVGVELIGGDDVSDGSLTGRDVKNRSLGARELGAIPPPTVTVRRGPEGYLHCPNGCAGIQSVTAQPAGCRKREIALGGGVSLPAEAGSGTVTASTPVYEEDSNRKRPTGWSGSGWVRVEGTGEASVPQPQAWVLCARPQ